MQDGFYRSRPIAADIGGALIAAFTGATLGSGSVVAVAANSAAPVAGVTDTTGGKASYGLVDLQLTKETDVRYGGTVAAGDPLMAAADGTGRAVKAVKPASGVTAYVIGFAQVPGVADDIGKAFLSPFVLIG